MTFYEEMILLNRAATIARLLNIKKPWASMSIEDLKIFVEKHEEKYERLKNFK